MFFKKKYHLKYGSLLPTSSKLVVPSLHFIFYNRIDIGMNYSWYTITHWNEMQWRYILNGHIILVE